MKLQGKQVRFRSVMPWFGRRRLVFHGGRNTIQLLETAMVIEGYQQRLFFFPIIDSFFRMPFSEWTTVTVPYSRVLRFHYARMLLARIVTTFLAWLPFLLVAAGAAWAALREGKGIEVFLGVAVIEAPLLVLALVVTLYANLSLFAPRYYLWFRQADGRRALVVFRIPSRAKRLAFEEQLREYRRATREKGVAMQQITEAELAAPSPGIWIVLLLFLLGHQVIVPLYQRQSGEGERRERAVSRFETRQQDRIAVGRKDPFPPAQAPPPAPYAWVAEWAVILGGLLFAVLPPLLTSLALVVRRNEAVRWSAFFALIAYGMWPAFRLAWLDELERAPDHGGLITRAVVSALFHLALALAFSAVTAPEPKEDVP